MNHQTNSLFQLCESAQTHVATVIHEMDRVEASNREVARYAGDAAEVSASGIELAHETTTTFDELRASSDEIGEVVRLIDNVAGQTHLLALNATIEAARAGEAGAGFVVVAAEVKNLAAQTANATQQVTQRISAIQSSAVKSIQAIEDILQVVTRIAELQSSIASEMHEQDGMTQIMQDHVNEVSTRLVDIAQQVETTYAVV